jgi:glycerol-3-phosphate dehydrogenase (NAD(P)+)
VYLPQEIRFTTDLAEVVTDRDLVLCVVPSHAVREVMSQASPLMGGEPIVLSATKGIEEESLKTMSQVLTEVLGPRHQDRIAVLSGPSFATEVARGLPTAVTVAARSAAVAKRVQGDLSTSGFRVYTSTDILGVEIGGAVKNVIAVAVGLSDGLGFGYGARAALITRGLAEMSRLAVRIGAAPQTLSGLSGLGDLALTCTGELSRNRSVGLRIGRGETLSDILKGMRMVAEGVRTSRSVYTLARNLGVEMPITEQVYSLLYENKHPKQVVADLLAREVKPEFYG